MRIFKRGKYYHLEISRKKRVSLKTTNEQAALKKTKQIFGELKPPCRYCGGAISGKRILYCSDKCKGAAHNEIDRYGFLREEIMSAFNHQCAICGWKEKLIIHHVDGCGTQVKLSARNNSKSNLIVLCGSCHSSIHIGKVNVVPGPHELWIGNKSEEMRRMIVKEMMTVNELKDKIVNVRKKYLSDDRFLST